MSKSVARGINTGKIDFFDKHLSSTLVLGFAERAPKLTHSAFTSPRAPSVPTGFDLRLLQPR